MKYIPPWKEPYFIGVAGCSGSGKTSITSALIQKLNVPWTILLSMDNFYLPLSDEERKQAFQSNYDFDSPTCCDFDLMYEVLQKIKRGEKTDVPVYSFKEHARTTQTTTIYGANVVFIEGIYALYDPRILEMLDLKVFVHEDYDVCMARRLHRDILYRGRELKLSIVQWHRFVKPNYLAHILPTQKRADIVLPRGLENLPALEMLYLHVRRQLQAKSAQHLSDLRALGTSISSHLTDKCRVLELSNQVRALHTMLANVNLDREQFIHTFDRMADLLITQALELLYQEPPVLPDAITVTTPQNIQFKGLSLDFENICAVTMVRGGECFETALKASIPTIFLGRLLIQSDNATGEPKLHTCRLPQCLGGQGQNKRLKVILTEGQIMAGAASVMAIAVLVDHGVSQDEIILVAYSGSEIGVRRIHAAFPRVRIVIGRIEPLVNMLYLDTRYYGT